MRLRRFLMNMANREEIKFKPQNGEEIKIVADPSLKHGEYRLINRLTPEREQEIRSIIKEDVFIGWTGVRELLAEIDALRDEHCRLVVRVENIEKLRERIVKLREALHFYANNDIHTPNFNWVDNGSMAKAALAHDNELEKQG